MEAGPAAELTALGPALPPGARALLIGTAHYEDERLPPLPAVANNLADLAEALGTLGGLPRDRIHVFADPGASVLDRISEVAEDAEGLLLCYFAGHGFDTGDGELYLGLHRTKRDRPQFSALRYIQLREALTLQRRARVVVLLDCCHSGLAHSYRGGLSGPRTVWVYTAGGESELAHAPAGQRNTEFTRRLLATLRRGVPDAGPSLTGNSIREHLEPAQDGDAPEPRSSGTDEAGDLPLFRNLAWIPARDRDTDAAPAPGPGPEPTPSPARKRSRWLWALGTAAALALAGAVGFMPFGGNDVRSLLDLGRSGDLPTLEDQRFNDDGTSQGTRLGWTPATGRELRPGFRLPAWSGSRLQGDLLAVFPAGTACPAAAGISVSFLVDGTPLETEVLTPVASRRRLDLRLPAGVTLGLRLGLTRAPTGCRPQFALQDAELDQRGGRGTSLWGLLTR